MRARAIAFTRRLVFAGGGQCGWCGTWFPDWNGGTCAACKAAGH